MALYGAGVYGAGVYGGLGVTTAPVLVPLVDAAPIPRILVTFLTFAEGTERVTITRFSDGREWIVREGFNVFAVGGVRVQDFEAPFGVLSTYRAQQFDADGNSLGYTESGSTVLNVFETWMHQPLDPSLGLAVQYRESATKDIVRPTPGRTAFPQGARLGRYIGGGDRRGVTGVTLDVATDTLADADMLNSLWGTYTVPQLPVICIRTPAPVRLPRTLFAWIPEPHELEVTLHYGGELIWWGLAGDEVQPPAEGLVVPLLTYDDLDVSFSTTDARDSYFATYLDQDTAYEFAGAASA